MHLCTLIAAAVAIAAFGILSSMAADAKIAITSNAVCTVEKSLAGDLEVGDTITAKDYPKAQITAALKKNPAMIRSFKKLQKKDAPSRAERATCRSCRTRYQYLQRCNGCWVISWFWWRAPRIPVCQTQRCVISGWWWRRKWGVCVPRTYNYRWVLVWCPTPRPFGRLRFVRKRLPQGPCCCRRKC